MTFSSFFGKVFGGCFSAPKTLVGCDDYGTDLWAIGSDSSIGIDDTVCTLARGCDTSSKVRVSVKRMKNGVRYDFATVYDDLDAADAARAEREMNAWLAGITRKESCSTNSPPSSPKRGA